MHMMQISAMNIQGLNDAAQTGHWNHSSRLFKVNIRVFKLIQRCLYCPWNRNFFRPQEQPHWPREQQTVSRYAHRQTADSSLLLAGFVTFWVTVPTTGQARAAFLVLITFLACMMACSNRHTCCQSSDEKEEGETHYLYETVQALQKGTLSY